MMAAAVIAGSVRRARSALLTSVAQYRARTHAVHLGRPASEESAVIDNARGRSAATTDVAASVGTVALATAAQTELACNVVVAR